MRIHFIVDEPPFSLIAQTSVEFGAEHAEDNKMIIGEQIKEKIFQFLPELPRDISHTKYHKWKYSQVTLEIIILNVFLFFLFRLFNLIQINQAMSYSMNILC
jgi:hypothetical protein